MKRLAPLVVLAALLTAGCGRSTPAASSPTSPPASPAAASASPSPSAVPLTPAELLESVLIGDDLLKTTLNAGTLEVKRGFDGDRVKGWPVGVVTACGKRAVSSTKDAAQVKVHIRAWTINGWIMSQEAYVLPKQRAADVLATVTSTLKGCKSYSMDGETIRRTAGTDPSLESARFQSATACFGERGGLVQCYTYLGRGSVVTMLSSEGEDQAAAELLLRPLIAAAEARMGYLPA